MEKSSKRGKIPQSDWPLIMARYEAGETLASIARTYDCSPPAISYIVSRSRARQPDDETAAPSNEPQLVKVQPGDAEVPAVIAAAAPQPASQAEQPVPASTTGESAMQPREDVSPPQAAAAPAPDRRADTRPFGFNPPGNTPPRNGTGEREGAFPGLPPRAAVARPTTPPPGAPSPADQRRTLHLSLGNGSNGNGIGSAAHGDGGATGNGHAPQAPAAAPDQPQPQRPQQQHESDGEGTGPRPAAAQQRGPMPDQGRYGFSQRSVAEPQMPRGDWDQAKRKDAGGNFIDQELRERVDGDIAAFLTAFDAALAEDSRDSRSALREATDRLLRAGARTRIELERLEARVPLPPRDVPAPAAPAWRPL